MTDDLRAVLWCVAFAILFGLVLLYFADDEVERQRHERGERPWMRRSNRSKRESKDSKNS